MKDGKYIVTGIERARPQKDRILIQPIDNPLGNIEGGHIFNHFEADQGSFALGDSVSVSQIYGIKKTTYDCRVRARIISADGTVAFCKDYGDVAIKLADGAPRPARGDDVILGDYDEKHRYEILENLTALRLRKEFLLQK